MDNLATELLCITDTDGQFRYVNPVFERVFGYNAYELIELSLYDILCAEDVISLSKTMQTLLKENQDSTTFELRHRCKDGSDKWISWNLKIDWTENLVYSSGRARPDKKLSEETLKECDYRYKQIFDCLVPALVYSRAVHDENEKTIGYRIIDVNPAYEKITGFKKADVIDKLVSEIMPDLKNLMPSFIEVISKEPLSRKPHSSEQYFKNANKWFKITLCSPLEGYVVSNFSDITERKNAEENLMKASKKLLAAQEFAHLGFWELDINSGEFLWSDERFQILGLNPQDYKPTFEDFLKLVHPDDITFVLNAVKEPLEECEFDIRIIRQDNSTIWIHEKIRYKCNASGEPVRIYGVAQDVTQRKLSEIKLKESEEKFKELAENLAQVIWVRQDERLVYINPAYEKVWGRTCQSLYDNPDEFIEAIHPDDKERILQAYLGENRTSKGMFDEQFKIIRPDGTIRWVWDRSLPIYGENGRLTRCVGISADITEIKEYEDSLRHAKDLAETANKAKSMFLANMSHELRTPLNGILGMAQLLGMSLEGESKEMADIINTCGNNLINIINDILDLSKIEAVKARLVQEEFDIDSLVSEVDNVIQTLADQKRLEYNSNVDKEIRGHLVGDSGRLKQVLLNLLGNAIKFTQRGNVELSVRKGLISKDNLQLVFSVKDTGIGIADDKIGQLFAAFMQVDDSYTKNFRGTGLGLAISKQLVSMMDGEICVESKLGVGSKFTFSATFKFKADIIELIEVDKVDVPKVNSANTHVLLVEDDYISGMLIKRLCERKHINLKIATNGKQALEILEREDFEIIVMDIQMPIMDGYETTKIIRDMEKGNNYRHTPIVATTAYALVGDREKCIEAGMDGYLEKPIDAEKFYSILAKHISKGTAL